MTATDPSAPPGGALEELKALADRARRGDETVLPRLRRLLDEHPEVYKAHADLGTRVRDLWLARIAGADLFLHECLARRLDEMRDGLAGPAPDAMESLLVDRVLSAWLQVEHADGLEALATDGPSKAAAFRLRRSERLNRRFLAAAGALAAWRRLGPKPVAATAEASETAPDPEAPLALVGAGSAA
jgi:hypothetical protein